MAVWPNGTKTKPTSSGGFGWRIHPITGARTFHYGWDNYGYTYNCAPEAGVVIFAQYNGTAGNHIQIRTPSGVVYGTMHNAQILVSVGQQVAEGQALGIQGTTGGSTGIHNHQEVLVNNQYVDPEPYIAARIASTAGNSTTPIEEEEVPDMHGWSIVGLKVGDKGNQWYIVGGGVKTLIDDSQYPEQDKHANADIAAKNLKKFLDPKDSYWQLGDYEMAAVNAHLTKIAQTFGK